MRRVAAPLAAVLAALALGACGDDGAEPGAPEGATLVLDFQPNAVHAGLYAAKERGYFADEGIDLEIREPSSSADSAKLLQAGRADFAIMDINDFGIARERGAHIAAIVPLVRRPLASVIAASRDEIRTPADLEGKTVGVTGVPSDDAILDTVLASAGLAPGSVDRVTIGFNAVSALAAGRIDAATAFWNAEGVQLESLGVPTREFRVDERRFDAPRYPELVIVAKKVRENRPLRCGLYRALDRAYPEVFDDPESALEDLLGATPRLDESVARAQLDALVDAEAFPPVPEFDYEVGVWPWNRWAGRHGLISRPLDTRAAFPLSEGCLDPDS